MDVSVIIPVYNAEQFIQKAVESALQQKQAKEIILIEDKSPDNSLQKCICLSEKYRNVKLITNDINKGASESRNIGIKAAKYPYIAFLDADDYYLPEFFDIAEDIFNENSDADGVFGSIGAYFYNKKAKSKHYKRLGRKITGLNVKYNPKKDNLLNILFSVGSGHFSIIGMVIKRKIITKIGGFDKNLVQAEDTDFIWRLSYFSKLYAIDKDVIVAIRGVHCENRVLNEYQQKYYKNILLKKWINKITAFKISSKISRLIIRKYLAQHPIIEKYEKVVIIRILLKILILIKLFTNNPLLIYYFLFNKRHKPQNHLEIF